MSFREGLATYGTFHNLHRLPRLPRLRDGIAARRPGRKWSRGSTTRSPTRRRPTAASRPSCARTPAARVDDNLAPHGWFAAELVALIRNMLVREHDARDRAAVRGRPAAGSRRDARRSSAARRRVTAPSTCRCPACAAGRCCAWNARGPRGRAAVVARPGGGAAVRAAAAGDRARRRGRCACPDAAAELRISWRLPRAPPSFDGVTVGAAAAHTAIRRRATRLHCAQSARRLSSRPGGITKHKERTGMGVLDGKVAIVTGSARGIGRATAELLSEQGASVLINDLDGDVAEQTASEIAGDTGRLRRRPDRRPAPADELVADGDRRLGQDRHHRQQRRLHDRRAVHKMSDDAFQRMLDIHTIVPFRVLRAAAPHLREPAKKEKRGGRRGLPQDRQRLVDLRDDGQRRPGELRGRQGRRRRPDEDAGQGVGPVQDQRQRRRLRLHRDAPDRAKVDDNTMEIDGEKVQLGIPEQMRGMALDASSRSAVPARPRRPPAASSSSARRGRTTSTGQTLNVTGGQFTGMTS